MNARIALSVALAGLLWVPAVSWVRDASAEDPVAQPEASASRIDKLIRDLGDDSFDTRTKATEALRALGRQAVPALRKAMKEADSEEVRWRAEQILLQLEGAKSEPLGGTEPRKPDEPDTQNDPRSRIKRFDWRTGNVNVDEILKSLREQLSDAEKRFEDLRKRSRTLHVDSIFGAPVEAPNLRLERRGVDRVRLHVGPWGARKTYEGASLEAILEKHPELRDHAHMKTLQEKARKAKDPFASLANAFMVFGGRGGKGRVGVTFDDNGRLVTRSVDIEKTDTGVKVKVVEKGADGKETVTEVEGESLEAIKRENPELAKKLGGIQVHMAWPQLFLGDRTRRRALELDPLFPRPTTPTARRVFGVSVDPVSESLASQLGLERSQGVVIKQITPGSAAEKIGLERYDILLSVDDNTVTRANVRRLLAEKVDEGTPVRLEIMRRAQRTTLTR